MTTAWNKSVRREGKLKVFNGAKTWSIPINSAIESFNAFTFGVTLELVKLETGANVVIQTANGATSYDWDGDPWVKGKSLTSGSDFRSTSLHGKTIAAIETQTKHIHFAVIFLPGAVKKATNGQKHVIVIHEFLHAAGLIGLSNSTEEGHEDSGVMYPVMSESGQGLIESFSGNTNKPMPPIRLGPLTHCKLHKLWKDATACQVDI